MFESIHNKCEYFITFMVLCRMTLKDKLIKGNPKIVQKNREVY